jgi:hypothetical protein
MTVTFLVAVVLQDLSSIADVAGDIEEDLTSAGHEVESVKPWARPTIQASGGPFAALPPLLEPNTQQQ